MAGGGARSTTARRARAAGNTGAATGATVSTVVIISATQGGRISDVDTQTTYLPPADVMALDGNPDRDGAGRNSNKLVRDSRLGRLCHVGYFQTRFSYNVNSELRELGQKKRRALSPDVQKVVDTMDRSMASLNKPLHTIRWTTIGEVANHIGVTENKDAVIQELSKRKVRFQKDDYTSSSYDPKANAVAGVGGRNVLVKYHYGKGAKVMFSPTRKEGEVVGARDATVTYSDARMEWVNSYNERKGTHMKVQALVVDAYVD